MSEQVKITISVPSDATDFKQMTETLSAIGMKVDSVTKDLGLIKGEVHGDHVKTITRLDGVAFVFHPA